MQPYTSDEADWLSASPLPGAAAIPEVISRTHRQWQWRRASAALDLVAHLITAFRRWA